MERSRKRQRPTKEDVPENSASEDEFEEGLLNGEISSGDELAENDEFEVMSDDESVDEFPSDYEHTGIVNEEDDEEIDSDEIPSSDEEDAGKITTNGLEGAEEEEIEDDGVIEVKDANGNRRYIYPEIIPDYDSDDTDAEETNTIGNIPLSYYESYPHIGYDINGKRIMRPASGKALDALLESIDLPKGWTGMIDKSTGADLKLTDEELEMVKKISMSEVPQEGYDMYPDMIEYFTGKGMEEIMPLSAAPEPKRRFIPSRHEQKRVMKIVRGIREGRILPHKPQVPVEEEETQYYDIWADETPSKPDHIMNIPAPKLAPPTHDESYNPPPEYLPTDVERKEWEEADKEDRDKDYLPRKHNALRLVPGYDRAINERFERCLDLYLAPRVRRNKLNIDPSSLLPKLPSPQDLRPFPTTCSVIYKGHVGRVRSVSVDPTGLWLATGGDDGTIRVWEILTGREVWQFKCSVEDAVDIVCWRPVKEGGILAAACGEEIFITIPTIFDPEIEAQGREIVDAGWGYAANNQKPDQKEPAGKWAKPTAGQEQEGVCVTITLRKAVKHLAWHRRGDYFVTVSPDDVRKAVCIHRLSTHFTQSPFKERSMAKGIPQRVQFHPTKPLLFVATKRYIKIYDMAKAELTKTLIPGARWISSLSLHPGGDNLLVGTYDKRLLWHDLDLSTKPYRTLRYHTAAIRAVKYHPGGLPLFASSSDDGTVQVFHGRVFSDLMENAVIVPLKVLKGHKVTGHLGVLDVEWHGREGWLFSAGADGVARMWN